jgi:hypothetical protein
MATWTFADIRTKTRQVSGRLSVNELNTNELDTYINRYLQYEFPAEVKLNRNLVNYEFNTEFNVQSYDFPSGYTNFVPEAWVENQPILFYQNTDRFYLENSSSVSRFPQWVGDGVTVSFTNTYGDSTPIQTGSVLVDDQVEVFTDNGSGVLTGSLGGTGTVNYSTGAIAVTFNTAPANGQSIDVSFVTLAVGSPTAVLMFDNQFVFYPMPDRAYRVRMKAWSLSLVRTATGGTSTTLEDPYDRPLLDEWGPTIAFGAARHIVSDFGEADKYAELTALYKEQVNYILTRTHVDLESTRALPMF